ncbi:replication initiation protein [Treponema sp.]|uniref:replication initiation protein n=1 Tax=Treponema sp. TaxID=166 RepID=UPI00298E35A0|nr:replication initiation protein [Treponema sp.]MCQ2241656.1 replication initiation protein [Treponema sp.]
MNDLSTTKRETVIQSNSISRGIYTCSPLARKLIAYCILKIDYYPQKIENSEINTIHHFKSSFSISEFINKLGISKGSNTYTQVKRAVEELTTSVIQVENTEEKYKAFTWFSSADYDKKKDLIELEFNQQIGLAIIEWKEKKQYSAMNIKIIGELQSFYALRFFEIACSWYNSKGRYGNEKDQWKFDLSVEEIKRMFKIDKDAYKDRMNNFITKVVKNPLEELNRINKDFTISYTKIVEHHRTVGFTFTCTQCDVIKIEADDTSYVKEEKRQLNDETIEMEYYKTKYPEEWAEAMKLAEEQNELPFDFAPATEARALNYLLEKGLK